MNKIIVLFCLFIVGYACNEQECFSPPEPFRLLLQDSSGQSVFNTLSSDSIKLFIQKEANNIVIPFQILSYNDPNNGTMVSYLQSAELPWNSIAGNKDFTLVVNSQQVPLKVDVVAKENEKCTYHPYLSVSYNNYRITNNYNTYIGAFVAIQ